MVLWGYSPREILQRRGIGPDFSYPNPDGKTDLDYLHRKTEKEDIYFVRNKNNHWEEVSCLFRVTGRKPELWIPEGGEIQKDVIYDFMEGGTKVKLRLPPGGSVFVLFRNLPGENHVSSVEKTDSKLSMSEMPSAQLLSHNQEGFVLQIASPGIYAAKDAHGSTRTIKEDAIPVFQEVTGPWEVTFPAGWGAPARKVFPNLISWTDDEEEGVKYFSGTATYRKEIEISSTLIWTDTKLFLDLGKVGEIADVFLNGEHCGILWKPPYRIEITNAARQGKNELIVEVTNLWVNRLAGDLLLPANKRFCKTNQKPYTSDAGEGRMYKTLPSGLMGPVKLLPAKNITVRFSE